jgi:hypothetical protein
LIGLTSKEKSMKDKKVSESTKSYDAGKVKIDKNGIIRLNLNNETVKAEIKAKLKKLNKYDGLLLAQ